MFTFQAIHNASEVKKKIEEDVKELISMFTFQAIHNTECCSSIMSPDVKELISQCLLFKQFTTLAKELPWLRLMSKS